jgi:hypothetical protein
VAKGARHNDDLILPVHQEGSTITISASLLWTLTNDNTALCILSVNAPQGFAVNVKKLNKRHGRATQRWLLCRCAAQKGGGYSGRFEIEQGERVVISVDKKALQYDLEIPMAVCAVYFKENEVQLQQAWEMRIDIERQGETDGTNRTNQEHL